jgi:hypothetical protein
LFTQLGGPEANRIVEICCSCRKVRWKRRDIIKGVVSRDFDTLFCFHWIDLKVVIGPEQVNDVFMLKF